MYLFKQINITQVKTRNRYQLKKSCFDLKVKVKIKVKAFAMAVNTGNK